MSLKTYKIISVILASFFLGFFIFCLVYANDFSLGILIGSCAFIATMFTKDLGKMKSFYKSLLITTILSVAGIYLIEHFL